jgi:hypothetical protein
MGIPCRNGRFNGAIWVLFLMLAMDLCVDTYHFRVGHVERMCRQMLSPFERESPTGTNSQAAEQRKCR